ncbi:hypothetical protein CEXT_93661 [Caerostris extrusa]|uniref:Uncharacterized protein n=1 Tax=Caerostris extrusa TaxID=172846 RepID=A0AAV4Q6X4_CAEEX|nr:hypothetical protein CEXT_93661 [Caerostris extrusa]
MPTIDILEDIVSKEKKRQAAAEKIQAAEKANRQRRFHPSPSDIPQATERFCDTTNAENDQEMAARAPKPSLSSAGERYAQYTRAEVDDYHQISDTSGSNPKTTSDTSSAFLTPQGWSTKVLCSVMSVPLR